MLKRIIEILTGDTVDAILTGVVYSIVIASGVSIMAIFVLSFVK